MDALAFEHHLTSPQGLGRVPRDGFAATAGGAACCDDVEIGVALSDDHVVEAGFTARGCGAATAAGSAAVALVSGRPLLDAARIGAAAIAAELGGLSPGKFHAADLAAEALARALGAAAWERGRVAADRPRRLVAMSGGVDSAVAALLSAREDETVAVTVELWADHQHDPERSCCSASAVAQARKLAHDLELPHFTLDLRDAFRAGVVEPFIDGYAEGETPNPCIACNGQVRLDAMLALAERLGCATLATGHYARTAEEDHERGPLLRTAVDSSKDQSYMLAALTPSSLARMRFPLGGLTKAEVRRIAADADLPVAAKADSQDLCFLAGTDRASFLARHGQLGEREGELLDRRGNVLGHHRGQHRFTVGQRRGLGVSAEEALFVLEKDALHNRVTIGPRHALIKHAVSIRRATLHREGERVDQVKLRYRSRPLPARLPAGIEAGGHSLLRVDLREAADAPAPGQLACLMDGDVVIGWGTIARG